MKPNEQPPKGRYRVRQRRDLRNARGEVLPVKPGAEPLDGQVFEFEPGWVIDKADKGGMYVGETAMLFTDVRAVFDRFGDDVPTWIASGDLEPMPKKFTPRPGERAVINGDGDLACWGEIRPHIGELVEVVKVCKSGLYQVRTSGGLFSVAKYNLSPALQLPRALWRAAPSPESVRVRLVGGKVTVVCASWNPSAQLQHMVVSTLNRYDQRCRRGGHAHPHR